MVKGEPGTQTEANSIHVPNSAVSTYAHFIYRRNKNAGSTPRLTRMIALSYCSRTSAQWHSLQTVQGSSPKEGLGETRLGVRLGLA